MPAFFRLFWTSMLLAAVAAPAFAWAGPEPARDAAGEPPKARPALVHPDPAVWLLADEDTKIYLLGTVHMLPPGFAWRSPLLDRIIGEADELVEETYEEPGDLKAEEALDLILMDKPDPILGRVPKDRQGALKKAIVQSHIPISFYDRMHTWLAAMMLGMSELLGSYGIEDPNEAPGVEDVLEQAFREAGKPISSVEDPMKVIAALNAIPAEAQTALLLEAIAKPGKGETSAIEDESHQDLMWAKGDVEGLGAAFMKDFPPFLIDPLVRNRNQAWTGWLQSRLERPGTVLFAVGAGHLAGPDSVQRMLAARGLTVTRLN